MKNKTDQKQSTDLVDAMKAIGRKSKGAGLRKSLSIHELKDIQEFLCCSREEAFFFVLVGVLSVTDDPPAISNIAEHLGQEPMELISILRVLRSLQRKGLIRRSRYYREKGITELQFYVPSHVFEAISNGDASELVYSPPTDAVSLFAKISKLSKMVEEEVLTQDEYRDEVHDMVRENPGHYTCKNLMKYGLSRDNTVFILSVGTEYVKGTDEIDLGDVLAVVFSDEGDKFGFKRDLISGTHPLVRKGLLRLEAGIFKSDRYVYLTEKGLRALFDWDSGPQKHNSPGDRDIIEPKKIGKRTLYFNRAEADQLSLIRRSLSKQSYREIIRELEQNNLPSGISILLHGPPGTGKTEAVYQLARSLRKKILTVDISQTKNLYFGESEKLIKQLFDRYNLLVKNTPNTPILLFNEADGVLGKRKDVTRSSVAQTENAMQNIILQEMETLKGIMIATTNLTSNLDKAFERRFLYKVRFGEPTTETRAKIWKEHIPHLKSSETIELSERFPFSGGHIANVASKVILSQIIHQRRLCLEDIAGFCSGEKLDSTVRRIGFRNNSSA